MYGSDERIQFNMSMKNGDAYWSHNASWEGLIPQSVRLYGQTNSEYRREELEKFMRVLPCPACNGQEAEGEGAGRKGRREVHRGCDRSFRQRMHRILRKSGAETLRKRARDSPPDLERDPLSPGLPGARGPWLPHALPECRHPFRWRGAAHPTGHADRLKPDGRSLCPGRALHRPSPAGQRPADRDSEEASRPGKHPDSGRA